MKVYYDLHIHTALSPCGDMDMTPNNIVNMAALKELDCIAITDHNTCGNVRAAMKAAESIKDLTDNPLIVIPGIEAETSEEIHMVCLFSDIEAAEDFGGFVYKNLPDIENKEHIFGEQAFFDENDNKTGVEKRLLVNAAGIDLYTMVKEVKQRGGVCFPAHIDRQSYSVLSSLGFIPPDLDISLVEVSKNADPVLFMFEKKRLLGRKFKAVQSSDAHYLEDIFERTAYFDINTEALTAKAVIDHLKSM